MRGDWISQNTPIHKRKDELKATEYKMTTVQPYWTTIVIYFSRHVRVSDNRFINVK